jgi:magnesium transporter
MNFHHMPELSSPLAYPVMIAATASICALLFVVLRRAKWL